MRTTLIPLALLVLVSTANAALAAPPVSTVPPPLSVAKDADLPPSFKVTLDAALGYGVQPELVVELPRLNATHRVDLHFPVATVGANLLWSIGAARTTYMGLRASGFVGASARDTDHPEHFQARLGGGALAWTVHGRYLFGALGLGFHHIVFEQPEQGALLGLGDMAPKTWVDLHLAGGVRIPVSRRVALRLNTGLDWELGQDSFRVVGTAGVELTL